jgi:hypothetical protein
MKAEESKDGIGYFRIVPSDRSLAMVVVARVSALFAALLFFIAIVASARIGVSHSLVYVFGVILALFLASVLMWAWYGLESRKSKLYGGRVLIALSITVVLGSFGVARSSIPLRVYFLIFKSEFERVAQSKQSGRVRIGIFEYDIDRIPSPSNWRADVFFRPVGPDLSVSQFEFWSEARHPARYDRWNGAFQRIHLAHHWSFVRGPELTVPGPPFWW